MLGSLIPKGGDGSDGGHGGQVAATAGAVLNEAFKHVTRVLAYVDKLINFVRALSKIAAVKVPSSPSSSNHPPAHNPSLDRPPFLLLETHGAMASKTRHFW